MSTLMRAPRHCGSWFWDLDEVMTPGLDSALSVAMRMIDALKVFDLFSPVALEYKWYVLDSGPTGVESRLTIADPPGGLNLSERVSGSRPAAFPSAEPGTLHLVGSGAWSDAEGNLRREARLIDISVTPDPTNLIAELSVHHDIWSWFDFSGRPHPEVYNRNAPRLAEALREITSVLGVEPEPGEPTYFGHAVGYGVSTGDPDENGLGLDVTDHL
ncbi:hypothetical protein ACFYW1_19060 [Streptomyces sp. NPDC002669]|uniref:hypothetical protein n=1 Tax=Streptomyces sp. NPDC002669 TaxID=3364658 RepID=UPI00369C7B0E